MNLFQINIPTKFYIGTGSLSVLSDVCTQYGKRAFIVTTGKDMEKIGILERVTDILKDKGVNYYIFDEITPNPKTSEIEKGAALLKSEGCDFLITLGGGSSIDAGKNISMVVANKASIYDFLPGGQLVNQIERKRLPLIAIATTAGTGSEATRTAVVTNERTNEKYGVKNECIYPVVSIVDPELMLGLPKGITAVTGIDVFFHAMEAFLSNKATPLTDMMAKESMRLVIENLEKVYKDGSDIEARSNMAWASTLGGIVLDNAICIGIHGLGQPAGGYVDAVHGKTLCAVFYAYMKYTWKSDVERYACISKLFGMEEDKYTEEQLAEMSGDVIREFIAKLNLNNTLSDLGIKREMIPDIAKSVLNTTRRTLECCKMEIGYDDIVRIYEASL